MSHRIERVNELLRQELSELLKNELKDPRLGNFVAITDVCTSPDLKYTKVYVSFMGSEEEKKQALTALNRAAGFFRHELATNLKMRTTPEVSFLWDDSIERGNRLLCLLDQVEDEQKPGAKSPS